MRPTAVAVLFALALVTAIPCTSAAATSAVRLMPPPSPAEQERPLVRVIHLGDSHTAAMAVQAVPRDALQRQLGYGGSGYGLPWTGAPRRTPEAGATSGWHLIRFAGTRNTDPLVGLTGCAFEARGQGARAWVQVSGVRSRLYLLRQPGAGVARVILDGVSRGELDLDSAETGAHVVMLEHSPNGTHLLEVQAASNRPLRILGVSQESSAGLVYSTLGAPGARASWLARIPESVLRTILEHEAPDLLVLAFGTNEAVGPALNASRHRRSLDEVLRRVKRAAPGADLVLVTPPDAAAEHQAPDSLDHVTANISLLAAACGAEVVDLRTAMGGPGSIHRWRSQRLARPDLVHFRPDGYARLGAAIADAITRRLAARRVQSVPATASNQSHDEPHVRVATQ